jgi:putative addiction module killer protein
LRIQVRIDRLSCGNFGSHRDIDGGIGELRLDFGPGYRLYYVRKRKALAILLCGGTKATQARDIARAVGLAARLEED